MFDTISARLFVGNPIDEAIRSYSLGYNEEHFSTIARDLGYSELIDTINSAMQPINCGIFGKRHARVFALVAYEAALYELTREQASVLFIGTYLSTIARGYAIHYGSLLSPMDHVGAKAKRLLGKLPKARINAIMNILDTDPLVLNVRNTPKTKEEQVLFDALCFSMKIGAVHDVLLKQTQLANIFAGTCIASINFFSGSTSGMKSLEECEQLFVREKVVTSPTFYNCASYYTRWAVLRKMTSL